AQLASDAFKALESKKYAEAIETANECVFEFGKQAERDQKALEDSHAPMPGDEIPAGERPTILKRGVLNDVASCHFVKGEAYRFQHKNRDAEQAYQAAALLTY